MVIRVSKKAYCRGSYHSYSWARRLQKRKQKFIQSLHLKYSSSFVTNNDSTSVHHDLNVSGIQNYTSASVFSEFTSQNVTTNIEPSTCFEESAVNLEIPPTHPPTFREELAYWTVENGITIKALTNLLGILKSRVTTDLPKVGRTILRTLRGKVPAKPMDDGYYFYLGLEPTLRKMIRDGVIQNTTLKVDFHFISHIKMVT